MTDVLPRHHGGDKSDKPPRHSPIVPSDYESAPSHKRRQHSKSLTIYQLFNKLGCPIPIQFDLEGEIFYVVCQYFEHCVWYIGSLIRQQIPPCYWSWKSVLEEL